MVQMVASELLWGISLASVVYVVCLGVYRIFLSPIAHIPGPLLARLTYWYEFYYDAVSRGQYVWKIQQLHRQYGPVIRISPEEVHIADPDFYDDVYSGAGRKRNKWNKQTQGSGITESVFATPEHDLHRMRRGVLNPFFSKQKVRSLQPNMENIVHRLLDRLDDFSRSGEPLHASDAFAALAYDIVYDYAFGRDEDHTGAPDFAPAFRNVAQKGGNMVHVLKAFPWLQNLIESIPESLAEKIDPEMGAVIRIHKGVESQCDEIYADYTKRLEKFLPSNQSNPTIFHQVLDNPSVPKSEKLPARLWQDGYVVLVAGTLTTADALSWSVYGLLAHPHTLRELKDELQTVMPTQSSPVPPLQELERLPYLTGVIHEALRISNGVTLRSPRIDPEKAIVYTAKSPAGGQSKKYIIPPNTPVSMTAMDMHFDGDVFPDPKAFIPERWLSAPPSGSTVPHANSRYYTPFSRGTRQCLGINLAYAELYLTLAMLFRRYGSSEVRDPSDKGWLELYEFNFARDLAIVGDGALPLYSKESKGVRLRVRKA